MRNEFKGLTLTTKTKLIIKTKSIESSELIQNFY